MPPRFLLDTNICIYIAKHNPLTNNEREFACIEGCAV